jgi:hypothetical protein
MGFVGVISLVLEPNLQLEPSSSRILLRTQLWQETALSPISDTQPGGGSSRKLITNPQNEVWAPQRVESTHGSECRFKFRGWVSDVFLTAVSWLWASIWVSKLGTFQNQAGLLNLMVEASKSFLKPTKSVIRWPMSRSSSSSWLKKGCQGWHREGGACPQHRMSFVIEWCPF